MTDWIKRWEAHQTEWHKKKVNSRLIDYLSLLNLQKRDSVFVPLCGKSLDMIYLLEHHYKVIGVELSELAVTDFFSEHGMTYSVEKIPNFEVYYNDDITLYCGSVFDIKANALAGIKAVYDRASLVALNSLWRNRYATLFHDILPADTTMLLLSFYYDQERMAGPPFAVGHEEITTLFNGFDLKQLDSVNDIGNAPMFRELGLTFFNKESYLLKKRSAKKPFELKPQAGDALE